MTMYFDQMGSERDAMRNKPYWGQEVREWLHGITVRLTSYCAYAEHVPQWAKDRIYQILAESMIMEWPHDLPGEPEPPDVEGGEFILVHRGLSDLHDVFHALAHLGLTDSSSRHIDQALSAADTRIREIYTPEGGWKCAERNDAVDMARLRAADSVEPQPAPLPGTGDVWAKIIAEDKMSPGAIEVAKARREFGLKKYGVPVQVDNGRDHLQDMFQEVADTLVYAASDEIVLRKLYATETANYAAKKHVYDGDDEYLRMLAEEINEMAALRADTVAKLEKLVAVRDRRIERRIYAIAYPPPPPEPTPEPTLGIPNPSRVTTLYHGPLSGLLTGALRDPAAPTDGGSDAW